MRELSYFVFTSGEEGVRGLDWGIKFASSVLGDNSGLDTSYRDLLQEFALSPSLERPDSGVGILLLPYRAKLLIYIFPGYDTLKRLNTIAVACNIPSDIASSLSVREAARRIWSANDLVGISEHGSFRPDFLKFPDEAAPSIEYPFFTSSALMTWPTNGRGYLSINGNIRKINRKLKAEPKPIPTLEAVPEKLPPRSRSGSPYNPYKWIIAACLASVIAGAGIFMMMKPDEPKMKPDESNQEPPKNEQPGIEPSTTKITSNDNPEAMNQKSQDVIVIESLDKGTDSGDKKPESETHKPEDVFAVNRENLIDELRRLYDKQTFSGAGAPRITSSGALEFSTKQEKPDLNQEAIFSGGSLDDKKFFIEELNRRITIRDGEVHMTFFELDDRVKKGNASKESFDVYLGIFADQAIKHYKPINRGGN